MGALMRMRPFALLRRVGAHAANARMMRRKMQHVRWYSATAVDNASKQSSGTQTIGHRLASTTKSPDWKSKI